MKPENVEHVAFATFATKLSQYESKQKTNSLAIYFQCSIMSVNIQYLPEIRRRQEGIACCNKASRDRLISKHMPSNLVQLWIVRASQQLLWPGYPIIQCLEKYCLCHCICCIRNHHLVSFRESQANLKWHLKILHIAPYLFVWSCTFIQLEIPKLDGRLLNLV